jgi:hypothetical protein
VDDPSPLDDPSAVDDPSPLDDPSAVDDPSPLDDPGAVDGLGFAGSGRLSGGWPATGPACNRVR